MTKEEFFQHHFFTEKEAYLALESIKKNSSKEWFVSPKKFEGLNSGKPFFAICSYNEATICRLIELQQYSYTKYPPDQFTRFIIDLELEELYQQFTQ